MRVLIAEDDNVTRRILQIAVEKLGHRCISVPDGLEAWRAYEQDPKIDVIISDRLMPGMDGIELCRRVRESNVEWYPYFIFLTSLTEKGDLIEGLTAGADDYLMKPLDRDQLQARLLAASRVTSLHRRLNEQKHQLERLNEELFAISRQDALTSLGNRLRLGEDIEDLISDTSRYGRGFCAMLCDVDFFKSYNDSYGHLAGDDVLRKVASTISSTLRKSDRAYRYGGEEFLVTLPEQTLDSASQVAERLRAKVERLDIMHEARVAPQVVTVSIGIARLHPDGTSTADHLLREADEALYRAKSLGRNRVMVAHGREDAVPRNGTGR